MDLVGTGCRKCTIARVVLQEGDRKIIINYRDAKDTDGQLFFKRPIRSLDDYQSFVGPYMACRLKTLSLDILPKCYAFHSEIMLGTRKASIDVTRFPTVITKGLYKYGLAQ
ncbi:hypothetical protein ACS0TY_023538 [Phlomoides rotata]